MSEAEQIVELMHKFAVDARALGANSAIISVTLDDGHKASVNLFGDEATAMLALHYLRFTADDLEKHMRETLGASYVKKGMKKVKAYVK